MRKLKTADIPAFCRCLKALGVKDKAKRIAAEANSLEDMAGPGIDLVWELFDAATETGGEKEIYNFLAPIFETTPEALADMDLDVFWAGVKTIAEENNLTAFFKSAAAMMR